MTRLHVEVVIDAPPAAVWAEIEDVASHVEWMAEAVAIRFRSAQHQGVGTEIECDTRVGPLTTTDVLRFVEWTPPRVMGIEHTGAVKGSGRFLLEPIADSRTRFAWDEDLTFPLRLGGRLGGVVGAALLRRVWARNLTRLKRRIEA
ncbi:MAG TPA: SRPBCC family protein [Acidimicrobiia bacterium]|nr:SRPBCC family protein [Acidimicrobiia bacterium]